MVVKAPKCNIFGTDLAQPARLRCTYLNISQPFTSFLCYWYQVFAGASDDATRRESEISTTARFSSFKKTSAALPMEAHAPSCPFLLVRCDFKRSLLKKLYEWIWACFFDMCTEKGWRQQNRANIRRRSGTPHSVLSLRFFQRSCRTAFQCRCVINFPGSTCILELRLYSKHVVHSVLMKDLSLLCPLRIYSVSHVIYRLSHTACDLQYSTHIFIIKACCTFMTWIQARSRSHPSSKT